MSLQLALQEITNCNLYNLTEELYELIGQLTPGDWSEILLLF